MNGCLSTITCLGICQELYSAYAPGFRREIGVSTLSSDLFNPHGTSTEFDAIRAFFRFSALWKFEASSLPSTSWGHRRPFNSRNSWIDNLKPRRYRVRTRDGHQESRTQSRDFRTVLFSHPYAILLAIGTNKLPVIPCALEYCFS